MLTFSVFSVSNRNGACNDCTNKTQLYPQCYMNLYVEQGREFKDKAAATLPTLCFGSVLLEESSLEVAFLNLPNTDDLP